MNDVIGAAGNERVSRLVGDLRRLAAGSLRGLRVALVYGGLSAEDQLYISKSPPGQLSVTALSATLTELGTRFEVLDPRQTAFVRDLTGFDVVLSNLHGPFGEDGRLQGLLDYLRIPYCGSGVAASAVAADKILCKRMMESLSIATPQWTVSPDMPANWPGTPAMVKPRLGGSSVGMSLVRTENGLSAALAQAQGDPADPPGVLIEEHVPGVPVTVGLLELPGDVILVFPPLATQVHQGEFYDADAKLDADAEGTVSCAAADLPRPVLDALRTASLRLWHALRCHGMARVDFIATPDGTVVALEVNTTPGMSYESNFITAAALCGLRHGDVLTAILHEAISRPRYDAPLPVPDLAGLIKGR
jgi:D-alanine-D-alanine ligase